VQNKATPLKVAAEKGHVGVIKILLENKAAINQANAVREHMQALLCRPV